MQSFCAIAPPGGGTPYDSLREELNATFDTSYIADIVQH